MKLSYGEVRLVLLDGTETTVDCRYDGMSEPGVHQWTLLNASEVTVAAGMSLRVSIPKE